MISCLPTVDALLNATSALLLVLGYISIRRKNMQAHRACMLAAFGTSTLFLICYLTYHFLHGVTRFNGQGGIRALYFGLLTSHTVLAGTVVPLALMTLYRAGKGAFDRHRRLARWTLPVWLYVSVTGVAVYWMLYHLGLPR